MHARTAPHGPEVTPPLGPTLARIFVAGLLAGGLATTLVADEVPVGDVRRPEAHDQIMMDLTVAQAIEDDDDFDPDGGAGTTGLPPPSSLGVGGDLEEDLMGDIGPARPAPRPAPSEISPRPPAKPASMPGPSKSNVRRRLREVALPAGARAVPYHDVGGQLVRGYFVTPAEPLPGRPAVVVIHEWWGLNDQVRAEARRLGEAGYMALAVDLYRGEAATERKGALALMKKARADMTATRANLVAGLRYLKVQGAGRVGALGWCMGGGYALQLALAAGHELDAAVMYYGHTVTDLDELRPLRAPLLGLFAENDAGITPSLPKFRAALDELAKPHAIKIYAGAGHAFANPNNTKNHHTEYARDAWKKTLSFFRTFLVQEE
jgi:carboxymethylenebutenolidase